MLDPEDPPPKKYTLKPREFERLNAPPPPEATDHFPIENDVHQILRENKAVAERAGLNELVLKKVVSRRKRDYWFMLIAGNAFIVGGVAIARFNPISLVFGLAGVVMLSLALTWLMWFVMDDY